MADIIVKNESGSDVTYQNINSVSFRTTKEGENATFIAQLQANWSQNDEAAVDHILNRPFYDDGTNVHQLDNKYLSILDYDKVTGTYKIKKSHLPSGIGTQPDWKQTDNTAVDYIKNKPTIPSIDGLATEIYVQEQIESMNIPDGIATEQYVQDQIAAIGIQDGVATEEYVQEQIANIKIPDTQVQSDWDQTSASQKDYIKNRPFGLVGKVWNGLIEFEGYESFGLMGCLLETEWPIDAGEAYVVKWSESEYTIDAKDLESISGLDQNVSGVFIGNSSIYATVMKNVVPEVYGELDFGEDTGEPFFILCNNTQLTVYAKLNASRSVSVTVSKKSGIKKLPAEYLPDGTATEDFVREQIAAIEIPEGGGGGGSVSTEKVILEEYTFTTRLNYKFGAYTHVHDFGEGFPVFPLSLGDECVVVWDGVEYQVTVGDSSAVVADTLFVGNGSSFGLSDNNEPFGIAWDSTAPTFFALTDTDETEHTVRIYQKTPLSVSWENVTDKPFGGENINIFVDHSKVDTSVSFTIAELEETFVKLSNEIIRKDDFIGATFEATFPDGSMESTVVSGADLMFESNKGGFAFMVMGMVPVVTCYEAGEDTVSMNGATITFNVPEAGIYTVLFAVEQLASSQITKNVVKYLDNKYLSILEKSHGKAEFVPSTTFTNGLIEGVDGFGSLIPLEQTAFEKWIANREQVVVHYDGVEYKLTPQILTGDDGSVGVCVGNMAAFGGTGNNEPFILMQAIVDDTQCLICFSTVDMAPTEHTVAIYFQVEVDKIKEEYIPDSVKLPAATAEDNNKFLRLVDGVPTWVSLTDVSQEGA